MIAPKPASIPAPVEQQTQVVDSGSGPGTQCRICTHSFVPDRFDDPCDRRCPVCRAAGCWWTREQLGTRAQVYVTARESAFRGETGVGERMSRPEDGWRVKLLSGGKAMFFGAAAVALDIPLGVVPQAE